MSKIDCDYLYDCFKDIGKTLVLEAAMATATSKQRMSKSLAQEITQRIDISAGHPIQSVLTLELWIYIWALEDALRDMKQPDPTYFCFSEQMIRPNSLLVALSQYESMDAIFWTEFDKLCAKDDRFYNDCVRGLFNIMEKSNRIRKPKMPKEIETLMILPNPYPECHETGIAYTILDANNKVQHIGTFTEVAGLSGLSAKFDDSSNIKNMIFDPTRFGSWLMSGENKMIDMMRRSIPSSKYLGRDHIPFDFHFFMEVRKHFNVINVHIEHEGLLAIRFTKARTL